MAQRRALGGLSAVADGEHSPDGGGGVHGVGILKGRVCAASCQDGKSQAAMMAVIRAEEDWQSNGVVFYSYAKFA